MSYKKENTRSTSYLCTISWGDSKDHEALEALKRGVSLKRKLLKARGVKRLPVVTVKYRKPLLPYNPSVSPSKYGWGGTVKKSQLPLEADIYLHNRYL
jgi:hypothetical protein